MVYAMLCMLQTHGQQAKAKTCSVGKLGQQKKAGTRNVAAAVAKKETKQRAKMELQRQAALAALQKLNEKAERMKARSQAKIGGALTAAPGDSPGEARFMHWKLDK